MEENKDIFSILREFKERNKKEGKKKFTFDGSDDYYLEQDSLFEDYLFLHNVADVFGYLLKLEYANSKDIAKNKHHRLEIIFQNYLKNNKFSIEKIKKIAGNDLKPEFLKEFLLRGWYNELVALHPISNDYLNIGTSLNTNKYRSGPGDQGDFTWKVTQTYYSVLDFMRVISYAVDAKNYPARSGYSVITRFSENLEGKLNDSILFYPFTVFSGKKNKAHKFPDYCKYAYSSYPRDHSKQAEDLDVFLTESFEFLAKEKGQRKISILDILYYLREWANYFKIEPLLKLNANKSGYMKFLLKNISVINFFFAGFAELIFISTLGEDEYLELIQKFSSEYIEKVDMFGRENFILPLYVRLRVYKHLGLINNGMEDFFRRTDPIRLI
jgi:hypothetical protein